MQTENIDIQQPQEVMPSPDQIAAPPVYKKPLFWGLTVGGILVLGVLACIFWALKTGPDPETTEPATESSFTEETEATLPPPDANPIGLGDFYMDGNYLSCLTAPSTLGIDVSEWQGKIQWQQVKEAGVEFAMIRAGYRGFAQGVLAEDACAQANYQGAAEAGIQVGAYFFSQAISVEEAQEEARYLLEIIQDWNVDMPIVFDWEYVNEEARTAKVDARTLTDCTKAFCETIAAAGYQPMIYFNAGHSYDRIYIRELTEYPFWLARYDTVLNYPYKIDMWQYTETGSVPGISGNVDINLLFSWE